MVNQIFIYEDCGAKAAKAMNQHDVSLYKFYQAWLIKAIALENASDAELAKKAYADAYELMRNKPVPFYFK